ncbi:MAG: hypothetical protein M4579_002359 [Chaenotheca gracillima]|nr:MAG: hypothetical protein M4579_002359 [Chaenotheca gracillima]
MSLQAPESDMPLPSSGNNSALEDDEPLSEMSTEPFPDFNPEEVSITAPERPDRKRKRRRKVKKAMTAAEELDPFPDLDKLLMIPTFVENFSARSPQTSHDLNGPRPFFSLPAEIRNNVYEYWALQLLIPSPLSVNAYASFYPANLLPLRSESPGPLVEMIDPSQLNNVLEASPRLVAEFLPIYQALLSRYTILFDSIEKLHVWLHCRPRSKCYGLTSIHIVYKSYMNSDRHDNDNGQAPHAYDAFTILARACPNLRHITIEHYGSYGPSWEPPLFDDYPGVWALRGIRGLRSLKFRGSRPVEVDLRAKMQREMKWKREGPKGSRAEKHDGTRSSMPDVTAKKVLEYAQRHSLCVRNEMKEAGLDVFPHTR